jgi:DNA-binding NarL/FixJ family response regulator/uncharacterized protein (DUF2225 family)
MARILVVDDSSIIRRQLISILTQAGHTIVGEATNGGQAHLMYRTYLPDLVTMDITMPGVDGIEAVKLILKDFPEAKIIMVSALNQRNMVFQAMGFGAKYYLLKPFTEEYVKNTVQKVLGANTSLNEGSSEIENGTVESKAEQPFVIESVNNTFQIKITKFLNEESFKLLEQAMHGLLYVKPLNVILDFGNLEVLPDPLLDKIGQIANTICSANGILTSVAQNDKFIQLLKAKKLEGLLKVGSAESANMPANTDRKQTNKLASSETDSGLNELYLLGYKHYSLDLAEPKDNVTYAKKVTCPICDNPIEIQAIRFTKLAIDKVDHDSRQHFAGFEPLWYVVQICPNCKYANFAEDFTKITERDKKIILEKLSKLTINLEINSMGLRNIDQVFTAYYLALFWLNGTTTNKLLEGKLWLRLTWLYEDVNDPELSKLAAEKALASYKDFYQNNRAQTSIEQDQRLRILLAELCVRNGLKNEALKYFRDTIVHKGGNKVLNETARDRIHDINEEG